MSSADMSRDATMYNINVGVDIYPFEKVVLISANVLMDMKLRAEDALLEAIVEEIKRLKGEVQRLRTAIDTLQEKVSAFGAKSGPSDEAEEDLG